MKWYFKLILPALFLVAWGVAAVLIDNSYILPNVWDTLVVFTTPFADLFGCGSLVENSLVSIYRVSLGFVIACIIAVPLGILLGRYQVL